MTTLATRPAHTSRPNPTLISLAYATSNPPVKITKLKESTTPPYTNKLNATDTAKLPQRDWDRMSISARYTPTVHWADTEHDLDRPLPRTANDITKVARTITTHILNTLLGHTPPSTLRPWLAPEVYGTLVRRTNLALRVKGRAPMHQRPRVGKIFVSPIRNRAFEVSLVAHDGSRGRAIALRLEYWRERWRVMAMEIG